MPDTFTSSRGRAAGATATRGGGAVLGLFGDSRPGPRLALPIAERVRAALMRASDREVPWQVYGKTDDGRPRRDHQHLYILPFVGAERPGRAPRLDRVLLWAEGGLEPATLALIDRLAGRGGWVQLGARPGLRLEVLDVGTRAQISATVPARILGPGRRWRSATSFVAPRFPKHRRGAELDPPRAQLSRLLAAVHGYHAETISRLPGRVDDWRAFEQGRHKQRSAPRRPASGWMLEFSEAVHGPLVLGYGAHFGLGRFELEKSSRSEDRSSGGRDGWTTSLRSE